MQTFILNTNLEISAQQLDNQRLNKQLVEAMQIYKANFENGPKQGNPYAYKMWLDWPDALVWYGCVHYDEWQRRLEYGLRGGKLEHKSGEEFMSRLSRIDDDIFLPLWLTEQFCSNHRSVMLGKAWEAIKNVERNYYKAIEIEPIEQIAIKFRNKRRRCEEILEWYQSFNWPEQPAQRVNGKWPYLWPVTS